MKKLTILAVMMVATLTATAQWSVTPKVGMNLATITNGNDAKMKVGLVAGADLAYRVSDMFAVSVGAFYSMQGAKGKEGSLTGKINTEYINVPILANVYVLPGLALKAGIQPGFNVKHKAKAEINGYAEEMNIPNYKNLDLSIPLGLSYEISDFVIDARYNLGLTKIMDIDGKSSKNSVIQFTVGYKIPL